MAEGARTPPLWALVGPTAVGKTAVGIALAERLGAAGRPVEILSADAVAVYRSLDIGAAKPTPEERARVPFHLIDLVDPAEEFTVADFAREAEAALTAIRARGALPLLVGGTGLYVRAVTAVLSLPNVAPQPALRARLRERAEQEGAPALHRELAQIDPAAAARIQPGDARRIIRAFEVYEVSGQRLSSFHTAAGVRGVPRPGTSLIGLEMERAALYRRIDARVEAMLASGFVEEVQALLAAGVPPESKAMQSLGYRHLVGYLRGDAPWADAVEALKRETRRFAKRQLSWFRNDPAVRWRTVRDGEAAEEIAARLVREAPLFAESDLPGEGARKD